jgi:Tfp pilus assembly protein PilF
MGDLYRAERYFRLLLNDLQPDHPDLGTILNNLGIIAHKQDQHSKAIQFFQRADIQDYVNSLIYCQSRYH